MYLLCLGGILALWLLILKGGDSRLKSFVYKSFLDHVLIEDLEQQLNLLKGLSRENKIQVKIETTNEDATLLHKYASNFVNIWES